VKHLVAAIAAALALSLAPAVAHAADQVTRAVPRCEPEERTPRPISKSGPAAYRQAVAWAYGDSITFQSRQHLKRTMSVSTAIDAHWGRATKSAVDALAADLRQHAAPAVVVMAAGTNDLQDVPAFRAQVVRARAMLPRSTRLLWVDVYVEISRKHYAANRAIRSVRGVEPLGWSRTNARSLRDGRSRLLSDGVHINARGCEMRNELIVAAVDGAARR